MYDGGAAITQWIRLRLPSCRPGFESQAFHLSFYKFIVVLCGKDENKRKKRPELAHLKNLLCTIASSRSRTPMLTFNYEPYELAQTFLKFKGIYLIGRGKREDEKNLNLKYKGNL